MMINRRILKRVVFWKVRLSVSTVYWSWVRGLTTAWFYSRGDSIHIELSGVRCPVFSWMRGSLSAQVHIFLSELSRSKVRTLFNVSFLPDPFHILRLESGRFRRHPGVLLSLILPNLYFWLSFDTLFLLLEDPFDSIKVLGRWALRHELLHLVWKAVEYKCHVLDDELWLLERVKPFSIELPRDVRVDLFMESEDLTYALNLPYCRGTSGLLILTSCFYY